MAKVFIKNWLNGPYTLVHESGVCERIQSTVPHKWFPGDRVHVRSGVVLERAPVKNLVGIVDFLNRTGYGFTPRGVPLYMFHPLDAGYPPMLVSSKTKYDSNMIVLVNMEHWDNKWPRAGIQRILGAAGDKIIERQALYLRADTGTANIDADWRADTSIHKRILWDTVFHIDPDGCEDVDDVIAWQINGDNALFAIAIADVSAWVPEQSPADCVAKLRGQTVYEDGAVQTPMLPTSLSSGAASLRCDGVERPVLAIVYSFQGGVLTHTSWQPLLLTVQKSFTYDSVYKEPELCAQLALYLESVLGRSVGNDSHIWIEAAMVEYNRRAAEVLRGGPHGLLRSHAGHSLTGYAELAGKSGVAELAWLGAPAGTYVRADKPAPHAGLGLDVYCHASSPLRRYADLVNQRALKHLLFACKEPRGCEPEALNHRAQVAKQLERDAWFLNHLNTNTLTTVTGVVLEYKESHGTWTVYVPDWRKKVRAKVEGMWVPEVGAKCLVRAFVDLRRCSWDKRIVCAIGSHTDSAVTPQHS
jgi:exoribonuclease R